MKAEGTLILARIHSHVQHFIDSIIIRLVHGTVPNMDGSKMTGLDVATRSNHSTRAKLGPSGSQVHQTTNLLQTPRLLSDMDPIVKRPQCSLSEHFAEVIGEFLSPFECFVNLGR